MITLFLFYLHVIAAAVIFTSRWRTGGWKEGLMGVGFLLLIFTAGWPMATVILKLAVQPEGLGTWLDRDAMSLALLTGTETVAVYFIALRRRPSNRPGPTSPSGPSGLAGPAGPG